MSIVLLTVCLTMRVYNMYVHILGMHIHVHVCTMQSCIYLLYRVEVMVVEVAEEPEYSRTKHLPQ